MLPSTKNISAYRAENSEKYHSQNANTVQEYQSTSAPSTSYSIKKR
jgi:hypothetical protein